MKKHPSKKGKLRVSQSLIKDMRDYLAGSLCGHVMDAKYSKNNYPDSPTAAMALGTYFEYITFGNLPKSGKVPQPEYMASVVKKNGGKTDGLTVDDMYEKYRTAHANSKRVLGYFKSMGIEIIGKGEHKVRGINEGTIDLRVKFTKNIRLKDGSIIKAGTEAIIDVKYSGLIDDRWSRHGWLWTDQQRDYHGTQSKQYHYLSKLPFFFFIKDPGDNDKAAFLNVDGLDEFTIEQHLLEGKKVLENVKLFNEIGWTPYPDLEGCSDCPLKENCKDKIDHPVPKTVSVAIPD